MEEARAEQNLKNEQKALVNITKEQSERINIYKAILAIMVVFIHAYQAVEATTFNEFNLVEAIQFVVSQVICRCAVPAYFFLSAFFLYRKPFKYKTNLVRKLKTLGIPYLIMNTVWILFFLVVKFIPSVAGFVETNVLEWGVVDFLDAYLGFKTSAPIVIPLWFLRDLLVLNVLSAVIGKVVEKIPVISMVVALVVWLFIPKTGLFFLGTATIVFWVLGCAMCKMKIDLSIFDKINGWILSIVYLLFIVVDILTFNYEFNMIIHNIGIIVGMLFWYECAAKLGKTKLKNLLIFVSTYSFGIYIFHERTMTVFEQLCSKVLPDSSVMSLVQYFVNPTIIICGCIILCVLLKRFVPGVYNLLTGSRG